MAKKKNKVQGNPGKGMPTSKGGINITPITRSLDPSTGLVLSRSKKKTRKVKRGQR